MGKLGTYMTNWTNRTYNRAMTIDGVKFEHPEREEWGDLAVFAKPGAEADELIKKLGKLAFTESVTRVGGFINIRLKTEYLVDQLGKAVEIEKRLNGKKIMFEYGQPNTHKMPHIGHLFSYIYGESMCRILESSGALVRRVNYQGDVGLHVAKCLWAYSKTNSKDPSSLEDKVKLLQEMYQKGSRAYDEDKVAKEEIDGINKKIYDNDSNIVPLWQKTREWSVKYYQLFEKRIGARFDHYYFENQVARAGVKLIKDNTGGVFKKSEGAVVYEGSHIRVFLTSEGNPTYEAKDLALEIQKMRDWPCDTLVITTAVEQNEYFKVVFSALEEVEPNLIGKMKHIGFGMINLIGGKMASRTGNIIGAIDLVNRVVSVSSTEEVGLGAIKYAFLKKGAAQNMIFDLKQSVSMNGNSGPYLQYTHVRICSVLAKSQISKLKAQKLSIEHLELSIEELNILRWIYRFPEVVGEAAEKYAPNLICNFLYELAQRYNTFYNKCSILNAQSSGERQFRLVLTKSVGEVLKKGLNLLGIDTPERM